MAHRHRLLYAAVGPILFFLFGTIPIAYAEAPVSSLVISEVNWAGSSRSQSDEWIEFMNAGTNPLQLDGFTLQGALTSGAVYTFPSMTLTPGATFLLANYAANGTSTVLIHAPDAITAAVSLSNSALGLSVYTPDGTIVDNAGNGRTPLAGTSGATIASMIRQWPLTPGADAASWKTAAEHSGLLEGATDLGTPGTTDIQLIEIPSEVILPIPIIEIPEPVTVTLPIIDPDPITGSEVPPIVEPTPPITEPILEISLPISELLVETPSGVDPTGEPEPDPTITLAVEIPRETVPTPTPAGTLLIDEVYSSPNTGEDEWVEIYNPFNNVIPLNGWSLRDGSGKSTSLPDQLLGFGQSLVIKNPAGKLNNDGDSVVLVDAAGHVVDAIAYGGSSGIPAPAKSQAAARADDGVWHVTVTPTPGAPNIIIKPAVQKATTPTITTAIFEPVVETLESSSIAETPPQKISPSILDLDARFVLSEFYPNTKGSDLTEEFTELKNTGDRAADLRGWMLRDRSGMTYVHVQNTILEPGEALALPRSSTRIALNNEGDMVSLLRPDKTVAVEVTYPKAPRGQSYGLFEEGWAWTNQATPDETNTASIISTASIDSAPAPMKKTSPPKPVKKVAPAPIPTHVLGIITSRSGRTVKTEKDGIVFSLTLPVGTDYTALGIRSGRLIEASGMVTTKNGKASVTIASVKDVHVSDVPPLDPPPKQEARIETTGWLSQFVSSAGVGLRHLFGAT